MADKQLKQSKTSSKHSEDRFSHYARLYFPLLLVFIFDRLAKNLALSYMYVGEQHTLIPKLLSLTLVFNRGIAFGIFDQHGEILVLLISIVLLIGLFSVHSIPRKYYIPFGLVLGGAFGNVFDRFLYPQGVVDFLYVPYFSVFNLADVAITLGIGYLLVAVFLSETHHVIRRRKKSK